MVQLNIIRIHLFLIASFFSLYVYPCLRLDQRQLRKKADFILSNRWPDIFNQQKALANDFKNCSNTITRDNLKVIISALAHKQTIPKIAINKDLLHKSIDLFHQTPGYLTLIKRLVKSSVTKDNARFNGSFYELELAIVIEQSNDETIVEFGKQVSIDIPSPIKREIDLETNCRWIECKNTRRYLSPTIVESIKLQTLDQKKMADEYNKTAEKPIAYEVIFKSDIDDSLTAWFKQNNIRFLSSLNYS